MKLNKIRVAKTILACISLMFIGLIFANSSSAKIDPKTITGMWLFDEGSGTVVKDSSTMGLNGKITGSPKWVDGKFGKALEFDGKGSFVEIAPHKNPTEAITVSAWAKSPTPTWNQNGWIVEKRDAFIIHPNQGGTLVAFPVCNPGCWNQPKAWDTGAIGTKDITQWHMYTGTFDGKTGEWKIYIDGKVESKLDLNKGKIAEDNGPIFIGNDTCCAGRFGAGAVDEVAVFNVALSEADVASLAKDGLKTTGVAVESKGKLAASWGNMKHF